MAGLLSAGEKRRNRTARAIPFLSLLLPHIAFGRPLFSFLRTILPAERHLIDGGPDVRGRAVPETETVAAFFRHARHRERADIVIGAGGANREVGKDRARADFTLDEHALMAALDEGQRHPAGFRHGIGVGDLAGVHRHAAGDDLQVGPDVRGVTGPGLEVGDEGHDALECAGQDVVGRRRSGG